MVRPCISRVRAAPGPPAGSPAPGGAAGGSPAAQQAWPAGVSGVQQAPESARGRPGGRSQAPQAARSGVAGQAAQPHAARRPQTAPLSPQGPLSRTAAQAGSQTHRPAAAVVKQQKETVVDTMGFQGLGCGGWLRIKPSMAAAQLRQRQGGADKVAPQLDPTVPRGGRGRSVLGLNAGVGAPVLQYWRCWAGHRTQMAVRLTARPAQRCCFPEP